MRLLRTSSGTYPDFASLISRNLELEGNLLQFANKAVGSRLREPVTSPAAALSYLGFQPARELLTALIVSQQAKPQTSPEPTEETAPELAPGSPEVRNLLRMAQLGEKHSSDLFVAGLVYDILRRIGGADTAPAVEAALSELWHRSFKITSAALSLAKDLAPERSLERDLAVDGMLHDIGLGLWAVAFPGKAPPLNSRESRAWIAAQGSLLLTRFRIFRETSWVCVYRREPYLARKRGLAISARSLLLWLAVRRLSVEKPSAEHLRRWRRAVLPVLETGEKEFESAILRIAP